MQSWVVLFALLAFLLVLGLGAGWATWEHRQGAETLASEEHGLQVAISRLAAAVWAVGSAQEAYFAPGQSSQPWFERTTLLAEQINDDLAALEPLTRSPEAPEQLLSLAAHADGLRATDASVRELLRRGQDVMAADVVLGDGRATVDAMAAELYALADYEGVAVADLRQARGRRSGLVLGSVGLVWAVALLWLALRTRDHTGALLGEPSF